MKLSEDALAVCNKCDVWCDVSDMKADGHGKFLCIECAYAQLESQNAELLEALVNLVEIETRDNRTDPDIAATDAWRAQTWVNAREAIRKAKEK